MALPDLHPGSPWAEVFTTFVPTIAAGGAAFFSWLNRRSQVKVERAITEVHLSVNSRLDELLAAVRAESHAAGMKDQRDATNAAMALKLETHK